MRPAVCSLLATLVLPGCASALSGPQAAVQPTMPPTTATPAGSAVVVEVIDGDTLVVDIAGDDYRLRLIGINAPESDECFGREAAAALSELVDDVSVTLVVDRSDTDQYGRLLRYVEVDGVDVGAELIAGGYALARPYPPDTARNDHYLELETAARAGRVGLWSPTACTTAPAGTVPEQMPGGELLSIEVHDDAAGADAENLNDEWVRFGNLTAAALDMSGWVVADNSASHRYTFADGFVLAAGATVTLRSGCGVDDVATVHWCTTGSAVWNNDGDIVVIRDAAGTVRAEHRY